jgi:hypothetical protein
LKIIDDFEAGNRVVDKGCELGIPPTAQRTIVADENTICFFNKTDNSQPSLKFCTLTSSEPLASTMRLHGAKTRKNDIIILTAVKTSYLTQVKHFRTFVEMKYNDGRFMNQYYLKVY